MEFRFAQWPELLKQSLAGTLMMWNFAWQAGQPDSDLFSLSRTGRPKAQPTTRASTSKRTTRCISGSMCAERLAALHEAMRLLVAYMPYKFHLHRIQQDLAQPWLLGYRRHPFTTRTWAYLDIDNDAYERRQA